MYYGSFGTQNSMVTFIFKLHPRKGQLHVKIGYIMSNFKIQNFPLQICLSCADLSQDSKKCHLFLCKTIRNAKNCISKMWRHYLHLVFWSLHSQKQRYCFEILCACFCKYPEHVYSGVLDNMEISDFTGNYLKKNEIWILGSKWRNIKNPRSPFWKSFNFTPFGVFDGVLLQN